MLMNSESVIQGQLDSLEKDRAKSRLLAVQPAILAALEWKGPWPALGRELIVPIWKMAEAMGLSSPPLVYCRCVALESLDRVLEAGVDVNPADSVIWATQHPDKALEYGQDPVTGGDEEKVMLLYPFSKLKRSWLELPSDTPEADQEELRKTYPTRLVSEDGSNLWFSRLSKKDRRISSDYETGYGYWIPGDPWEALLGVILLGRDLEKSEATLRDAAARSSREWSLQE